MTATNDVHSPDFTSQIDPYFASGSIKDRMPLEVARRKKSLRFCHTPAEHAEALARIAANDQAAD